MYLKWKTELVERKAKDMEKNSMELHKLLERSEKLDWSFEIYNEPELNHGNSHYGERNYVELRACSPAGEDFIMDIDFDVDDPISSFSKSLSDYAENFDIDEHVEKRLPDRGKGGCPSSIKVLVDDAEAIKNMIEELYKLLSSKEGMVKIEVTLEKSMRVCQEFEATEKQLYQLIRGTNPFQEELESMLESGYVEYNYSVYGENGVIIVNWA